MGDRGKAGRPRLSPAGAPTTFGALSPSHKRDYVEWVTEAKKEETRRRRIATAIAWMADGKARNWKHMTKKRG